MKKRYKDCTLRVPEGYEATGSKVPERKRIIVNHALVDYSVFRKSPEEKLRLKLLKAQHKS